jgi:hypothetical protein
MVFQCPAILSFLPCRGMKDRSDYLLRCHFVNGEVTRG